MLVMMALELVEEIGAQLWYVLDKDDQLLWALTVGEICVEEQNFIHPFSQVWQLIDQTVFECTFASSFSY